MKKHDIVLVVVIVVFVFLLALWRVTRKKHKQLKPKSLTPNIETFEDDSRLDEKYELTSWVINLDKNKQRWKNVEKSYKQSDMVSIPLKRFSAVVGTKLKPEVYLSKEALEELETNEKQGYRTRHYQLSRGGIGCFLSHYELYQKLSNSEQDMLLVFEDDIAFPKNAQELLSEAVNNAPPDWDILLFGFSRLHGYKENDKYIKPLGFWGTASYAIKKGGALKFLKECDIHKMDAQIDAYLSYLCQKGKLNIYATNERIIPTTDEGSDIQFHGVKAETDTAAFVYKGLNI